MAGRELTCALENSFRFRINEFARLLRKVNSSCYNVKADCLTFGLNLRTSTQTTYSYTRVEVDGLRSVAISAEEVIR
jgi:hypothetical protein